MSNYLNWEKATQDMVEDFVKKYYKDEESSDLPEYYWVADDVGGVLFVNDDYYDLNRIVDAFRYDATQKQLMKYNELELESYYKKERNEPYKIANFVNFVKHGITYLD